MAQFSALSEMYKSPLGKGSRSPDNLKVVSSGCLKKHTKLINHYSKL